MISTWASIGGPRARTIVPYSPPVVTFPSVSRLSTPKKTDWTARNTKKKPPDQVALTIRLLFDLLRCCGIGDKVVVLKNLVDKRKVLLSIRYKYRSLPLHSST